MKKHCLTRTKELAITLTLILSFIILGACTKDKTGLRYTYGDIGTGHPYPDVPFAVISDTHIYDTSLGSTGAAFEKTMNADRKLLLDSIDLLDFGIDAILNSGSRFVLIPGDLTKDGEMVNHRIMTEKLKRLSDAGITVYVVPGNHDINSTDAVRHVGDHTEPVHSASAQEFVQFYSDFGYNAALMRDDDSLSYVAEPVPGLWILALDACRYRENEPGKYTIVSGQFSQSTVDWMAGVLQRAHNENKAVMALMHHGVVEHWKGQSKLHPDYLVSDFANFGKFLASWNVRLAFTGHYHAQDITRGEFDGKFLYDIETGSLVTAPCPIRFITIINNVAHVRTDTIIDRFRPGTDFAAEGRAFVKKTVMLEAASTLKKYKVSEKDTEYIANAVGDAFTAHYDGDENPAFRLAFDTKKLGLWGRFVYSQFRYVIDGLWADLLPADNNADIPL